MGIEHSPTTGFYPNLMAGGNDSIGTVTLPNGLILKWGSLSCGAGADTTVTFAAAFPNACYQALACYGVTNPPNNALGTHTLTAASFKIRNTAGGVFLCRWFVVGR